ncbi:MAG: hypothetical protein AAB177_08780 [Nitrospirota bacterium]
MLTLDQLRVLLRQYADQSGQAVELLLIGGLADAGLRASLPRHH